MRALWRAWCLFAILESPIDSLNCPNLPLNRPYGLSPDPRWVPDPYGPLYCLVRLQDNVIAINCTLLIAKKGAIQPYIPFCTMISIITLKIGYEGANRALDGGALKLSIVPSKGLWCPQMGPQPLSRLLTLFPFFFYQKFPIWYFKGLHKP